MTIVTGTFQTYQAKGIREDLTDVIWNISPTETPFATKIARGKAEQTFHEWQTDSLASADNTNAQIEGDDISSFDTVSATTRLGNYTQISRKTVIIADTEEVVRKAGRKSEMAYQVAKKGKELKRDIENILVGTNQARAAGATGTARKTASVLSWIKTNTSKGGGAGADPAAADGTGTRTDGTQRAFTEALLQAVLLGIFTNSGDEPEMILIPGKQTQIFSTFTGNSTRYKHAEDAKLMAAIKVYEYDFGTIDVVPDRFMRDRDALVINTDLWSLAWLRPIKLTDLAKTGDAEKKMIVGEYALECRNEAGSGGVFDLT